MAMRRVVGVALGLCAIVACSSAPPDEASPTSNTTERTAPVLRPGVARFHPRPGDGSGVAPQVAPSCRTPKLTYFDGPVIQSPVIVPVFWSSHVNAAVIANMPQFFADVTQSTYWAWLWEYNSLGISGGTGQVILPGTATAGVTLTPSLCAGTANCTVTDSQVQSELSSQIAAGTLPAPVLDCTGNVETVYMVSFPPNVTVEGPSGAGTSCFQFCAYHNTGTYGTSNTPLIYGVLMDEFTSGCAGGCGGNATPLENTTDTASHELAEATTDPDIGLDTANNYASPAGWGDNSNNCGEIGDICDSGGAGDTITVSGRTWAVQELWSNKQNKCTSTGPANTCPAGDDCGTVPYGCATMSCGTCTGSETCQNNVCTAGCTPLTTCPAPDDCGTIADGCGGVVNCGTCASGDSCVANRCVAPAMDAGADSGTTQDSGTGMDSGSTQDSGSAEDSGSTQDSGGGQDSGSTQDAGSMHDSGSNADSGSTQDSGSNEDASTPPQDSGGTADASNPGTDSGALADSSAGNPDAASAGDASGDDAGDDSGSASGGLSGNSSGCGCRTIASRDADSSPAALAFGAFGLLAIARTRRKRAAG